LETVKWVWMRSYTNWKNSRTFWCSRYESKFLGLWWFHFRTLKPYRYIPQQSQKGPEAADRIRLRLRVKKNFQTPISFGMAESQFVIPAKSRGAGHEAESRTDWSLLNLLDSGVYPSFVELPGMTTSFDCGASSGWGKMRGVKCDHKQRNFDIHYKRRSRQHSG